MSDVWEIIKSMTNIKDKNYYKDLAKKHVVRWYLFFLILSLTISIVSILNYLKYDSFYSYNFILIICYILFFFWLPFLLSLYIGISIFKYKWYKWIKLYWKTFLILFLLSPILGLPFINFYEENWIIINFLFFLFCIYLMFSLIFLIISYTLINKSEAKTLFYNKIYYVIISILLLLFFYHTCSYLYEQFNFWNITDKYEYSYSKCEVDDIYWLTDIINKVYREGPNIILKAKISMNCWVDTQKWKVIIKDWNINMDVQGHYWAMTLCICDFKSSFKVKDVEKKDYDISFKVDDREIDRFTFLKNWEIKDKCTENPTYDCYFPKREEEKRKKHEEYPFYVTYENNEFSEIAKKYPKFEEYIYNYEYITDFDYYRSYKYRLKLEEWGIRVYTDLSQYTLEWSNGNTYEEAIKNYIKNIEWKIWIWSFTNEIKKQFKNIDILIAIKHWETIYFKYNNELLEYSWWQELSFRNRWSIDFYFDEAKDITSITEEELIDRIKICDKLYKYIEKNKYDLVSGDVKINKNNVASFWIYVYPENNDKKVLIHNKEILIWEKSEVKDIIVNINDL